MSNIYTDGQYLDQNESWHVEDSPWKVRQISKGLDAVGLQPASIVDVGCGAGEIARLLVEKYPQARCQGFDFSPQAMKIAAPKANERLTFHEGSPFGLGPRFDLAMAIDVFEHVEDYRGFLHNMRELAEWKIYHIPLDISVMAVMRTTPITWAHKFVGHIHYFTKETALRTLTDTGHKVEHWFYTPSALERPMTLAGRILANTPRRILYAMSPDMAVRLMGGWSMLAVCR